MDKEKLTQVPQYCELKDRKPKGFIEWIDFMQKNKPQTNALAGGIMLMIYGGCQIGWGIFNNHINAQSWSSGYEDDGTIFWVIVSFFIASLPGLLFGAMIHNRLPKIAIYTISSLFSIASSLLLIFAPSSINLITTSRVIGGFSHGLAYLTVLIHASEVAIPKLRGMIVATIHFCLIIGVFMASSSLIPVYRTRSYEIDPTQTIGYNGLITILSGMLIAIIFNRESPVFLMKRRKDGKAIETMIRLRSESHETVTIRNDFNEFRMMIEEDKRFSYNLLKCKSQLLIVLFFKFIFVGTFNMKINIYFLDLAKLSFFDADNDFTGFYLMGARWCTMVVTMFLIDFKRIQLFLASSMGCGAILMIMTFNQVSEQNATIFAILFQIFAGIAVGIVADIYSIDAVNTKIKPTFIAFTTIVEMSLQILLIVDFYYLKTSTSSLMIIFGILMILGIIIRPFNPHYTLIPDTSQLSLRAARNAFLKTL